MTTHNELPKKVRRHKTATFWQFKQDSQLAEYANQGFTGKIFRRLFQIS